MTWCKSCKDFPVLQQISLGPKTLQSASLTATPATPPRAQRARVEASCPIPESLLESREIEEALETRATSWRRDEHGDEAERRESIGAP